MIMMKPGIILALALASGCSVYPLPEDVMAYSSRDIATQVRCEAGYSVQQEIIATIRQLRSTVVYNGLTGSEEADLLDSDRSQFQTLKWSRFEPRLAKLFDFYKDTSVSYDFTLDGTEQNDLGLQAGVLGKFTKQTDTLAFKFGNTRTREVKRHYRIFDNFESLSIGMPKEFCEHFNRVDLTSKLPDKSFTKDSNYAFPSTGMLKIRTLIHDFLLQNETGNLSNSDPKSWTTADMNDTITFTTKSVGNVDPSAAITPAVHGFSLASIGLNGDNYRQDVHTIIIDVSLPGDKTGLPVFDESGRLISKKDKAAARVAQASQNLDKARVNNFQDDFHNLPVILAQKSQ
ncbi:hypothetical protein DBIPINDM_001309 [Mesorhizobium sp. AR02]|uniref:hypothetical protein n=1 Tax=Mesorhizobium sp. AR02 TaxID=2865837 RepID=UPI00215FC1DB|nr:hypothetical protein [Mesorhizobium sp. AR02]UVK54843.1 hypothetical protein DBIPINDM_001309 [Mesorhizobium sp. AR02]